MGRIKSTMVKKAAKQLLQMERKVFSSDFEHNKHLLRNTMPSKPIQNKIAGYISRLVRMRQKELKLIMPVEAQKESEAALSSKE